MDTATGTEEQQAAAEENVDETAAQEIVEETNQAEESAQAEETGEEAATSQIPEGEEAEPGVETPEVEKGTTPRGVQRKINKEVRKRKDAERDRDFYKRLAEGKNSPPPEGGQANTTVQTGPNDPEPKLEDFDDYDNYADARTRWVARQEVNRVNRETATMRQQEEAEQARTERDEKFDSNIDAFIEKAGIDDFDEVVFSEDNTFFTPAVADAIKDSEHGPAVAYHLAKHPEEAEKIRSLSPLSAAREIGKLEVKLGTPKPPPARKTTKAPAPIAPVGGNNEPVGQDPANMTMDEYAAKREKEEGYT